MSDENLEWTDVTQPPPKKSKAYWLHYNELIQKELQGWDHDNRPRRINRNKKPTAPQDESTLEEQLFDYIETKRDQSS